MSKRNWYIVFAVFIALGFVFGAISLYFYAGEAPGGARKDLLGNLWFGLTLVCWAIVSFAYYRIMYEGRPGALILYITWLLVVVGAGIALRALIMSLLR